ncbi:unnamed protein product [Mytilus edulis]|uniref:Uncharacterized protein n=1 Tax=Mytilus edulis TaxID=6550 RepID=A0A8S3TMM8_MYTED|nr:unnamed protein product [Mytilus edulis]
MPVLQSPIDGCNWKSQDLDEAFAAALTTALQIHDRTVHPPLAQPSTHKLKLDPPTIAAGCDPDQWSAFTRQWKMYKAGMAITDNVLPTALFYCCDTNLRTDIMRDLQGDVASMIETDLLKAIKRLAVKEESTLVQRIKLNRMTQSPGSNIRTFLASLRGQASLCQYKATCKELGCNHIFDYSDEIIKENLVRGIADPEIMSDLLGDSMNDRTLEETVSFIAQKEQVKGHYTKSCSKCTTCGVWCHRVASSRICAQGKGNRNPPNQGRSNKDRDQEQVGYIYEQLCTTSEQTNQASRLELHIFDGQWVARPSKPHPMLLVNMASLPEDHALFGHPMQDTSQLKTITMSMVADTGCQGLKATKEHVESLKEWLLDYYGATTFNVCEHQPLWLMNCEPLQLHVDPHATPVAVHKPALVPIHWQDKVYADLERDVRIGVMEQVSQNTPTTWCSRMVVTSKADGTPILGSYKNLNV